MKSGETFHMKFWHRPLHAMFDAFTAAGFTVERISEPRPGAAVHDRSPPEHFERLSREAPFIFFTLRVRKMHQLPGEGEEAARQLTTGGRPRGSRMTVTQSTPPTSHTTAATMPSTVPRMAVRMPSTTSSRPRVIA